MIFRGWMGVLFLGIAAVFGYHLWLGWRTRTVRFPVSILTLQEFNHEESLANFWGIMGADLIGLVGAVTVAIFSLSSFAFLPTTPVANLKSLDGCYEGEGSPDFLRPPVHWALRLDDGVISNRAGEIVAKMSLLNSMPTKTSIAFSPGILISADEHKSSTVYPGDTVIGKAYFKGSRAIIVLANDWGDVLLRTTCS